MKGFSNAAGLCMPWLTSIQSWYTEVCNWCHSLGLCFSEHFLRTVTCKYFSPEHLGWYLWSSWIAYINKRTNCLCKSGTSGAISPVNRDALVFFLLSLPRCSTQLPCCRNRQEKIVSELTVLSLPFQEVFCWTRAPLGGCFLEYWSGFGLWYILGCSPINVLLK